MLGERGALSYCFVAFRYRIRVLAIVERRVGYVHMSRAGMRSYIRGVVVDGNIHSCGQDAFVSAVRFLGLSISRPAILKATLVEGENTPFYKIINYAREEMSVNLIDICDGVHGLHRRQGQAEHAILRDIRTGAHVVLLEAILEDRSGAPPK